MVEGGAVTVKVIRQANLKDRREKHAVLDFMSFEVKELKLWTSARVEA